MTTLGGVIVGTTEVHYREGKPAISAKLHVAGTEFWPPELETALDEKEAGDIIEAAYERVAQGFWDDVAERAMATPLGRIYQDGRSGGWIVFDVDPTHGGDDDAPAMWLAAYKGLVKGVDKLLADAPAKVRRVALDIARDRAGERAARRMFAFASDIYVDIGV